MTLQRWSPEILSVLRMVAALLFMQHILCGDMAVAFFMAHFPKNWLPILNGGDLAVLFCFTFLYLWVAGPGPWSLDALLGARPSSESRAT